jgi:hypothetical protein
MANLLLSVMGAFAQFERELIRERQREGIELAKRAEACKVLTPERAAELNRRLAGGEGTAALAREFGVDRVTTYAAFSLQSMSGGRRLRFRGLVCVHLANARTTVVPSPLSPRTYPGSDHKADHLEKNSECAQTGESCPNEESTLSIQSRFSGGSLGRFRGRT